VIRHAAGAVPWALVSAACAFVLALMTVTAAWPKTMWPLQGVAIGLLCAVAAWSTDERAAAVVDTLPRPLWWRTTARSSATVPLALTWIACVLVAARRLPDHAGLFVRQGLVALVAGVALAAWQRRRGAATPGTVIGPSAVAVVTVLALTRPAFVRLPLFPVWEHEPWALSAAIWWVLAACAGLLLAAALWETPGARRSRSPGRRAARSRQPRLGGPPLRRHAIDRSGGVERDAIDQHRGARMGNVGDAQRFAAHPFDGATVRGRALRLRRGRAPKPRRRRL
jgi:hypothetical protein